jgi:formate dehydrogenase beta subunit
MVPELRSIQEKFGYLPAEQLEMLATELGLPLSQIHAVASFYPHFHLTPPARIDVRVCTDMSCHLGGADELRHNLERAFRGSNPQTLAIRDVSCLGRCDQAPALCVNQGIYGNMDAASAVSLVQDTLTGSPLPAEPAAPERVQVAMDPYKGVRGYSVVKHFVETKNAEGVISVLKASGLRGLGGAGFPTGTKWEIVRNTPGDEKYIVCNADESEPGTIKDRFIMENVPYLVIEGMITAGLVTGAKKGILYIRHEYERPREILQKEITNCYNEGLLGPKILGSDLSFDLEIFVSPGGYICGEESALLQAIEGKRAEPRNKPPFPGTHGLWQKPTAINNVETFAFAVSILAQGVDWYKAQGRNGSLGLKFVGISGDVVRPGVFEVPMGIKYSELIYEYAGGIPGNKKLLGFAPSGPSSGYLPASMVDLPLDWKAVADVGSMVGSGAIVVCAEDRCMVDMALNAVRFFRNESCGKCVPCRMGSQKLVDMLTAWTHGKAESDDLQLLGDLSHALRVTSICGLGQVVPAPIVSVLTHFRDMVDQHVIHKQCPAKVCFRTRDGAGLTSIARAVPEGLSEA